MAGQHELFESAIDTTRPLADRMRPRTLDEFVGQEHLIGPGKPLRTAIEAGRTHSMIFWGPPGTGKTTLGRLVAVYANARFFALSAVLSGVKEIREIIAAAQRYRAEHGGDCVLFVDEVHRFNKNQQDAFLPHIEDGTVIFVGATTENPSFELNNALLSRARIYVLETLSPDTIGAVIDRALADSERGLGDLRIEMAPALRRLLAGAVDGDARRALNLLENAADLVTDAAAEVHTLTEERILQVLAGGSARRFDKDGDAFYDHISALHKSIRGSHPDGALYWLARMLDGGCDPHYLARRLVRIASEDIGNADPRALTLGLDAWEVQERLGSPEGELALAHAAVYMACAPKSNAVYTAFGAAMQDARAHGSLEVPKHLRNAPTRLLESLGHGDGYRYAHDEPEGYAAGEQYLPEPLRQKRYYEPTASGFEGRIRDRLQHLRALDATASSRYRSAGGGGTHRGEEP